MPLSAAQNDALRAHSADYANGLTASDASKRRKDEDGSGLNTVQPPLNCPSWICCLLPCIKHIPSMKLFRQIEPEDSEVLRDGRWVRYDAPSLVRGDIIRLTEGDIVPADCTVLSLGMEQIDTTGGGGLGNNEQGLDGSHVQEDVVVDVRNVTGESKPRTSTLRSDGTATPVQLFYGGHVNQGSCIALVTAVGPRTLLASLIQDGRWPPKGDIALELGSSAEDGYEDEDEDEEVGVALIERAA